MMYHQKLAVAIKNSGKVLREFGDTVYVPFGSEYSILIKNLNTKRAKVKITIDGQDVLGGDSLVVNANSEVELERYITKGNLGSGNRFKFIERTSSIEQHRGVDVSDGLIRIEFLYERDSWQGFMAGNSGQLPGARYGDGGYSKIASDYDRLVNYSSGILRNTLSVNNCSVKLSAKAPQAEVGITVPGSISDQQFTTVNDFVCEVTPHVVIFKMMGVAQDQVISQPITVKHKPKCVTCGHLNKSRNKFCSECGTSLTIV